MEKRLDDLQQRLQSSSANQWCQLLSNELHRLSSSPSPNILPVYRTYLTREQLLSSIKILQESKVNASSNELYSRALANYLVLIAIHTHKLLCEFFLQRAYHVRQHLAYWRRDDQQLAIVDQIKTTFWFDRDRDDIRTLEKIKFLDLQEHELTQIIGRLAYTINALEQQDQIHLDMLMKSTNELDRIVFDDSTVNYAVGSDLADVVEFYSQLLCTFDELEARWRDKIHLYLRPTHFKRYLPYYIGVTAVGIYIVYRVYSNRDGLINYVHTTFDSLKFFVHEHLVLPLKTIYTSTFESRASQASYENTQLNYTHSKKILEEMLEDYGRQHAGTLAQINGLTLDQYLATINERAANEDMNIIMKNYQQELNAPIRSALFGDLIKGMQFDAHA